MFILPHLEQPCQLCLSQAAKHSKDSEVAAEVKAQLKEKIEPKQDPLAEVILEAGKAKLAKKPHDKQTELTSALSIACNTCMQQAARAACSHFIARLLEGQYAPAARTCTLCSFAQLYVPAITLYVPCCTEVSLAGQ